MLKINFFRKSLFAPYFSSCQKIECLAKSACKTLLITSIVDIADHFDLHHQSPCLWHNRPVHCLNANSILSHHFAWVVESINWLILLGSERCCSNFQQSSSETDRHTFSNCRLHMPTSWYIGSTYDWVGIFFKFFFAIS